MTGRRRSSEAVRGAAAAAGAVFALAAAAGALAVALGASRVVGPAVLLVGAVVTCAFVLRQRWLERSEQRAELAAALLAPRAPDEPGAPRSDQRSRALLLRPGRRIVPFRGRDEELAWLTGWVADDAPLAVALVVAGVGEGKTRLAVELCARGQEGGAAVGFLAPNAAAERVVELTADRPLLVVIDDAFERGEQPAALVSALAATSRDQPARVLLLARSPGDWWDRLREAVAHDAVVAELFAVAAVVEVGPVDVDPQELRDAFDEAVEAYARWLVEDSSQVTVAVPSFDEPASMLAVHLAALRALDDGGEGGAFEVLVDWLLRSELGYWEQTARGHPLSLGHEALQSAVAVAALTSPGDEAQAARLLAAAPDLAYDEGTRREIARWLRGLYLAPASGRDAGDGAAYWSPLAPQPLLAALVARAVGREPGLPARLIDASEGAQLVRVLAVLAESADGHGVLEPVIRAVLAADVEGRWQLALTIAQQVGGPLDRVFARLLDDEPRPRLAAEIERGLPEDAEALREVAVVATRQAIVLLADEPADRARDTELAALHGRLADRLLALQRYPEAADAVGAAVAFHRTLAARDSETHTPDLAGSLNTLSNRLGEVGRREDALAVIGEAVELYRGLAAARPDVFAPDLAMSLHNLSECLGEVGRREDALAAIEEAVELYRGLAAARPDVFAPNLAASLHNLSARLGAVGRREDALAVIEEAAELRRALAAAQPRYHSAELAASLDARASLLGDLGRNREALAAAGEAVLVHRDLAFRDPASFLAGLSGALNTHAGWLRELGHAEPAARRDDLVHEILAIIADTESSALLSWSTTTVALAVRFTPIEGRPTAIGRVW
ncbi:MAG TPA: tetratricopeptide repeat protein [Solirubrobacteraceae bacterium]|nr:tetratricopeptide repeat protein [Solirubrobacteraceae bacterium]